MVVLLMMIEEVMRMVVGDVKGALISVVGQPLVEGAVVNMSRVKPVRSYCQTLPQNISFKEN